MSATLARGSCPAGACDLDFLVGQSVRAVVSLNESDGDWERLLAERGMTRLRAPIPDHGCPTDEQMAAIVAFWTAHRHAGTVFVHCNAGQGRTGTVLCCLLAVEAPTRSYDDVIDVLDPVVKIASTSRRGSWLSAKQERFVRQFIGEFVA